MVGRSTWPLASRWNTDVRQAYIDSQLFHEASPYSRCELGSLVTHNIPWNTIELAEMLEEELCSTEGCGKLRQRNESDLEKQSMTVYLNYLERWTD